MEQTLDAGVQGTTGPRLENLPPPPGRSGPGAAGGSARIVAICLVRNEDRFIDRVIRNIAPACDEILIADHQSTDETATIARRWAETDARVRYRRIRHPSESHEMIRVFANTPTWVFPVDGDEVYDPDRLQEFFRALRAGRYDQYRQIYGHVLHCTRLDESACAASGYLAPPSRSMTKLYNFNAIYDWKGPCPEKCLGGQIVFKPGYSVSSNCCLWNEVGWDESPFRCLHLVFLRRSSKDPIDAAGRPNPQEKNEMRIVERVMLLLRRLFHLPETSGYKKMQYMKGALTQKNVASFFAQPRQQGPA